MKIAVVGAGLFGCAAALKLKELGSVDLYDEKKYIMRCASRINQYRLHVGYHYPRSKETAVQSLNSIQSFLREYGDCVDIDNKEHYYALSNEGSLVNTEEYFRFLFDVGLKFQVINGADWIDNDKIQVLIRANEHTIDISKLAYKIEENLIRSDVNLILNNRFMREDIDDYDMVVFATYSSINFLLPENQQIQYQFEVCEKPIIRLQHEWKDRSVVILDGQFCCIDPKLNSGNHVIGHVEHGIINRNVGLYPIIPRNLLSIVNSGLWYEPPVTNIEKFENSILEFFPKLKMRHIGSMYTIRTVLPDRDHDDARPSYITKHSDKLYSIFSGKLGTCVDIANDLVKMIEDA